MKKITVIAGVMFLSPFVAAKDVAGKFDYYKLALSYSQEFCIASVKPNQDQCDMSWIVHGLWPQYTKGYPAECEVASSKVDSIDKEAIWRFMPSDYLITHEWEKHGTCSGLSRSQYYKKTEMLWDTLTLPNLSAGNYTPAQIRQSVIDLNPSITKEMIELACDDNSRQPQSSDFTLDEIRICYTKDFKLKRCTERERSCDKMETIKVRTL